jgi:DNA-3-methyladenine glycosylase I
MELLKNRCGWVTNDPIYIEYHDKEWGVPVHEDKKHFEFLILEGAQAGLSWLTILRKREGYRKAFAQFNPEAVATYSDQNFKTLLSNPEIVRNKLKIQSAISNASAFLKVQEEFGSFDTYCWRFVDGKPKVNHWKTLKNIPPSTMESEAFSKDLKKRGFKFVGPTVIYAHMQAVGMVNDHTLNCFRYAELCHRKS